VLHLGRLWPHLQTLDKAGKSCQGQTLQLITKIHEFFHDIGLRGFLKGCPWSSHYFKVDYSALRFFCMQIPIPSQAGG
jgi:hypothetical protein